MTPINPLGTETFWVNVYEIGPKECYAAGGRPNRDGAVGVRHHYPGIPRLLLRVRPWIPHDGGPCPVEPHVRVRVREECGKRWRVRAGDIDWEWGQDAPMNTDIIAYQIIED